MAIFVSPQNFLSMESHKTMSSETRKRFPKTTWQTLSAVVKASMHVKPWLMISLAPWDAHARMELAAVPQETVATVSNKDERFRRDCLLSVSRPKYCGDGCSSNCNATAECGEYAKEPGKTCPLNVYCSQFG